MSTPRATLAAKSALAHKVMVAARTVLQGHDLGVTVIVHDSWLGPDEPVEVAELTSLPAPERTRLAAALGPSAES